MSRRGGIHNDDHAGFERPGRRSRPRTKDRPDYSNAQLGLVRTISRGRYQCLLLDEQGQLPPDPVEVTAMKARSLGRGRVIVGDRVRLVADVSGEKDTLARIAEVADRVSVLRRTADDDDPYERPIVANAEQLVIVTALADPPPRTGMIDRILVAGYDAGLDPVLCLTKADLASPEELVAEYAPLGIPVETCSPGSDLSSLTALLQDKVSVFVGHSGVGKSTLVNALIPGAARAIGSVNEVTGRGRHTSTSAIALPLPQGGWVIDTPGVRSFGLSHVTPERVLTAFGDLEPFTADCPRGCDHQVDAPDCALDEAWRSHEVPRSRVDSFRRMISARALPHES